MEDIELSKLDSDILAGVNTTDKGNKAEFKLLDNGHKIVVFNLGGKVIYSEWINPTILMQLAEKIRIELANIFPFIDIGEAIENLGMEQLLNNLLHLLKISPDLTTEIVANMNNFLYIIDNDNKIKYSTTTSHLFYEDYLEVYEMLSLFCKIHFIKPLQERNYLSMQKGQEIVKALKKQ